MSLKVQVEKQNYLAVGQSIHHHNGFGLLQSLRLVERNCTHLKTQHTACKNILIYFQFKRSHLFYHFACKNGELIFPNASRISNDLMIKVSAIFNGNVNYWIRNTKSITIPHTIFCIRHRPSVLTWFSPLVLFYLVNYSFLEPRLTWQCEK